MLEERPRVLVVDDDRTTLDALREILSDAGYEVAVAASTPDSIALFESFKPHVLLIVSERPKLDGRKLCDAARVHPSHPAVVHVSARQRPANETGPWLSKPLDLAELFITLRGIMDAHH